MYHIFCIYADDICLMAPSAFGLQKMLDVCFDFSLRNYIMINPVKSVCVTFNPKNSKLSCPSVRLDSNILEYISQTKYLGFMFNTNAQDDEDKLRKMRTMYIRSNKLLHTFHIALLILNWNCLKVTVPRFTVVIYGLHKKCQHLIGYV